MFNKKINLLFITLVFMLSLSAVAAFDVTEVNDTLETSDGDEEPPSGDALIPQNVILASQDDYSLQTSDVSMYYKNGTRYSVTLMHSDNPVENASVIINLNGINYTKYTDSNGRASLGINLVPGNYSVSTFYNSNSGILSLDSDIEVFSTLEGQDIEKIYKNDTQYYISVLDNYGNPLTDSDVAFNINGVFYTRKTNGNGIARLNINLIPGEYILTAVHENGLLYSNTITVLPSINGSDIVKVYKNGTNYHARFLNLDGSPLANKDVTFNINGVFYTRMTNADGMATLNINLNPGIYVLTAMNPVNGDLFSNYIGVLPTIVSSNIVSHNKTTRFEVKLISSDSSIAKNKDVEFIIDGNTYQVKTNDEGVASIELDLKNGVYDIVSHDLSTGLYVSDIINVSADNNDEEVLYYSKFGVSPDNKTLMAIGRPSAIGETSKYGYTYYMTVFERVCPYCGSNELYWHIFWTGDETSDEGIFPATGRRETGSAEGNIFCKHCDSDFSIFGNEHIYGGRTLKVISESVLSSKADAYTLKNGEMVYSPITL